MVANESSGTIDGAYLYRLGSDDLLLVVNASNTKGSIRTTTTGLPTLAVTDQADSFPSSKVSENITVAAEAIEVAIDNISTAIAFQAIRLVEVHSVRSDSALELRPSSKSCAVYFYSPRTPSTLANERCRREARLSYSFALGRTRRLPRRRGGPGCAAGAADAGTHVPPTGVIHWWAAP